MQKHLKNAAALFSSAEPRRAEMSHRLTCDDGLITQENLFLLRAQINYRRV
jgi:hypothetical protein